MKPKVLAVIPARFASKRFPGKPLSPIAGKPLIQHIYNAASKSKLIDRVVVATDSREIQEAVLNFGGEAVITSCNHRTGSDRAAEVMQKIGGEIIINIQADHIGVKPAVFDRVLKAILAIGFQGIPCPFSRESMVTGWGDSISIIMSGHIFSGRQG